MFARLWIHGQSSWSQRRFRVSMFFVLSLEYITTHLHYLLQVYWTLNPSHGMPFCDCTQCAQPWLNQGKTSCIKFSTTRSQQVWWKLRCWYQHGERLQSTMWRLCMLCLMLCLRQEMLWGNWWHSLLSFTHVAMTHGSIWYELWSHWVVHCGRSSFWYAHAGVALVIASIQSPWSKRYVAYHDSMTSRIVILEFSGYQLLLSPHWWWWRLTTPCKQKKNGPTTCFLDQSVTSSDLHRIAWRYVSCSWVKHLLNIVNRSWKTLMENTPQSKHPCAIRSFHYWRCFKASGRSFLRMSNTSLFIMPWQPAWRIWWSGIVKQMIPPSILSLMVRMLLCCYGYN